MARKKKEELELDEELDLDETEEELDEDETDEEEELDEEELEEPTEIVAESVDEEDDEPAAKPKRRAAKRKPAKKEPKVETIAATVKVEAEPVAAPAVATKAETPAPAPVAATVTPEEEQTNKQWAAAQQTSAAIVASLEKVNTLLREVPEHYAVVLQKTMKQAAGKPSPAAKIAFGMSMLATILSVLSLSFSQSARQSALSHSVSVPAIHHAAPPTTPAKVEQAQAPRKQENEALAAKPKPAKNKKAKALSF